jgi:hypothetical protein
MKKIPYFLVVCSLFLGNAAFAQSQTVEDSHAKAIRLAIESGGLNTTGHPTLSKDYGPFLIKAGFDTVSTVNYQPKPGDIRVFQPYPKGEESGFIDMYDGQIWISEYKETGFWPTPEYEKNKPRYQIFRWVKK